jgi:hypothetical protein
MIPRPPAWRATPRGCRCGLRFLRCDSREPLLPQRAAFPRAQRAGTIGGILGRVLAAVRRRPSTVPGSREAVRLAAAEAPRSMVSSLSALVRRTADCDTAGAAAPPLRTAEAGAAEPSVAGTAVVGPDMAGTGTAGAGVAAAGIPEAGIPEAGIPEAGTAVAGTVVAGTVVAGTAVAGTVVAGVAGSGPGSGRRWPERSRRFGPGVPSKTVQIWALRRSCPT